GPWLATRDNMGLRVWDLPKQREILSIEAEVGGDDSNPLAFKPDGPQLAFAVERWVYIHSTAPRSTSISQKGKPTGVPFSLSPLSQTVTALAYNQRGDRLAAGSRDGMVTVWDADDRRQLFTFAANPGVRSVAFSPDSNRIITTGNDGAVRIWSVIGDSTLLSVGPGIYRLTASHDRSRLGVYGGDKAHVVDPIAGSSLQISRTSGPLSGVLERVWGRIATATDGGEVTIFDATGQVIRT